jgi:hypothetical protein
MTPDGRLGINECDSLKRHGATEAGEKAIVASCRAQSQKAIAQRLSGAAQKILFTRSN